MQGVKMMATFLCLQAYPGGGANIICDTLSTGHKIDFSINEIHPSVIIEMNMFMEVGIVSSNQLYQDVQTIKYTYIGAGKLGRGGE